MSTSTPPVVKRAILFAFLLAVLTANSPIYGQCGPAAYPPPGHNPTLYNSAYSSPCNWNDPHRGQDTTIGMWHGATYITATQSIALAGAITSLKVGAKEYISSGGHGSSLNWAFYPQSYETYSGGECYNPTLSGTASDDSQPGWNYSPWLGPSTSAVLSQLGSVPGELYSVTRMAFYIPNGWHGFGGCHASYPNRSPYNVSWYGGNLSPFIMTQRGTWSAYDVPNVLGVGGTITAAEDDHKPDYGLTSIVYLQPEFDTYFRFDPATWHMEHVPLSSYAGTYPSGAGSSNVPIIASTADGHYAMGIIAERSGQWWQESHGYYLGYSDGSQYHALNTLQVSYSGHHHDAYGNSANLAPGTTLSFRTFYVFGNLDWVKWGISRIYQHQGYY